MTTRGSFTNQPSRRRPRPTPEVRGSLRRLRKDLALDTAQLWLSGHSKYLKVFSEAQSANTQTPGGPSAPPALWGHRQSNVIRGWAERLGQEAAALSSRLFLCEMGQESGFWVTDPRRLLAGKHVHPGLQSRVLSSVLEILLILQTRTRALCLCFAFETQCLS